MKKSRSVAEMERIVRDYTVILTPEDIGGFSVAVPALPEVATQGETIEQVLAMVREAIELALALRREEGESIPMDALPTMQRIHIEIGAA